MKSCELFMGLDPSYKTGYCIKYLTFHNESRGDKLASTIHTSYGRLLPDKKIETQTQKISNIIDKMLLLISSRTIQLEEKKYFVEHNNFFIEDYAFGTFGKSNSVVVLAELCGVIKHEIYNLYGVEPIKIAPTTVKKFLSGKGNSKKEDMLLYAYKKYGIEFENSDEADAYTICDMGISAFLGFSDGTKYRDEALAVVRKNMVRLYEPAT